MLKQIFGESLKYLTTYGYLLLNNLYQTNKINFVENWLCQKIPVVLKSKIKFLLNQC